MPEELGGGEDIRDDDFVEQAGELAIGQVDAVESLELFAEILFERGAVRDVWAVFVFETLELADEAVFDGVLPGDGFRGISLEGIGGLWLSHHSMKIEDLWIGLQTKCDRNLRGHNPHFLAPGNLEAGAGEGLRCADMQSDSAGVEIGPEWTSWLDPQEVGRSRRRPCGASGCLS